MTTKAEGASTEPDADSGAQGLAEVRLRRAELLEAINALEQALAAPGQQTRWAENVSVALWELSGALSDHVELTEGPAGLNSRVVRSSPRLAHAVDQLTKEHATLNKHIGELLSLVSEADRSSADDNLTLEGSDEVRSRGTRLLGALVRHRQRGADLVYEAFSVDIGGQD